MLVERGTAEAEGCFPSMTDKDQNADNIDSGPRPANTANRAGIGRASRPAVAQPAVSAQIRAFLAGETNGAALLHALYDHVVDETIPPRLRALLLHRRRPPERG